MRDKEIADALRYVLSSPNESDKEPRTCQHCGRAVRTEPVHPLFGRGGRSQTAGGRSQVF